MKLIRSICICVLNGFLVVGITEADSGRTSDIDVKSIEGTATYLDFASESLFSAPISIVKREQVEKVCKMLSEYRKRDISKTEKGHSILNRLRPSGNETPLRLVLYQNEDQKDVYDVAAGYIIVDGKRVFEAGDEDVKCGIGLLLQQMGHIDPQKILTQKSLVK